MNSSALISPPTQLSSVSTQKLMLNVIYCVLPATVVSAWFFGIGVYLNLIIAVGSGLAFEAIALALRQRPILPHLNDLSIIVSSMLLALALPIGLSWHLIALGMAFATLVAKHAFGGLGQNSFNPAMCGYLFLLLSYPLEMTSWLVPQINPETSASISPWSMSGLSQSLAATFTSTEISSSEPISMTDGMAMATPLIETKMASTAALPTALASQKSIMARELEAGWELLNLFYLFGGLVLIGLRVIKWHIPVAILGSLALISILFYSEGSASVVGTPYLHLLSGGTMLGAFFIATDPVSAPTTPKGRIAYGVLIGISIYSIRVWGSYLDGIAIAIIFGNFFAPLLDHLLKPTVVGYRSETKSLLSEINQWWNSD